MATTGQLWPASSTADATGTIILSGTATPTAGVGNVGEYYLDTDNNILYGPKVMVPGPPEYVQSQPASQSNGNILGAMRYRFLTPGQVIGVRFWVPPLANVVGGKIYLWSNTGTLLASKDTTGVTANAWNSINFDTPINVATATTYVVGYWNVAYRGYNVGVYPGVTTGNVSALTDNVDGRVCVFSETKDVFPTTPDGSWFGVSPLFTIGGLVGSWPVAVQTLDATKWTMWSGTQAAYDAIGTKDPNTLYVVV